MQGWKRGWAALATIVLIATVTPAASGSAPESLQRDPIDWEAPVVAGPSDGLHGLFDGDLTGLIPKKPFVQR